MIFDSARVFTHGTIASRDLLGVSMVDVDLETEGEIHALFALYSDGKWDAIDMKPWPCIGLTHFNDSKPEFAALSPYGEIFIFSKERAEDEKIAECSKIGPLTGIGTVDDTVFAVGMGYQVYRRESANHWTTLLPGDPDAAERSCGFNHLSGFTKNDLYAVGWGGEIHHYDGSHWVRESCPTNAILTSVHCASDGQVYICGRHGTLLRGKAGFWEIIDVEDEDDDFWSIVEFQGQIYVSGMQSFYRLGSDGVEQLEIILGEEDEEPTFFQLSVTDELLCSVGETDILLFDSTTWSGVPVD